MRYAIATSRLTVVGKLTPEEVALIEDAAPVEVSPSVVVGRWNWSGFSARELFRSLQLHEY